MNIFTSEFGAKAIWLDNEIIPNRYGDFIHDFTVSPQVKNPKLYISADTDYTAYINGRFVDCGQYDDYPDHKSYDVLDVGSFLVPGLNHLCVRAYHQGTGSCQYTPGIPLLVYALVWDGGKITSGNGGFSRQSGDYVSGPGVQLISTQLSYSFEYDAGKDDSWLSPAYKPGPEWSSPFIIKDVFEKIDFYRRPVKKLTFHPPVMSRLVTQGLFLRQAEKGKSRGELMYTDFLSARRPEEIFAADRPPDGSSGKVKRPPLNCAPLTIKTGNTGVYLILDMGGEEAGLFTLKVNASEGTVIDVAYGEHLNDLRVRSHIGNRNFSFTYICREGEQEFTHYMKRIAGRYLELHIYEMKKTAVLRYAGLLPVGYPLEKTGSFTSSDSLLQRILDVSERTLELCLHEHYEDCPWREQGLYAFDSRNQMLAGYYLYNNADFARANLALLAEKPMKNGFLPLTAPTDTPFTIPYFSLIWIVALNEYVLYSGDLNGALPLFAIAGRLVELMENLMDAEQDLAVTPQGEDYWNFYEWAPGLEGTIPSGKGVETGRRFDAPLNAAFCLALESAMELGEWLNRTERNRHWCEIYNKIKTAFNRVFWDSEKNLYVSFTDPARQRHYAELTQSLALCAHVVPGERQKVLLARLAADDNGLIPCTVSSLIFKYEALLDNAEEYAAGVFEDISAKWGHMLFNQATSFWETINGADDFSGAGSLCHGWTAVPAYFFFAYLLGIKPLKPGFAEYSVSPVKLPYEASGSITAPCGKIGSKVRDGVNLWKQ